LTIIIVCFVACPDMYSIKPDDDHMINNGYPVLNWETVVQEKKNDDKDSEENEFIEPEKATVSKWNGTDVEMPASPTKIDGENYLLITNANQLAFLSKAIENGYEEYLTYNYILQCDVNLGSKKFTPIGTQNNPFTGTFDGNGHIISNLKIDTAKDNAGLFGYVSSNAKANKSVEITNEMLGTTMDMTFYHNGTVKSLQIKNADITSDGKNVGAVAGCIDSYSRITNVSVKSGTVSADGDNVGGLVGCVKGENSEIYICYSTAKVTSKGKNVGGLVGNLDESRLSAAYASSTVKYNGKSSAKKFGAVVGTCNKAEDQLKNVFYNNEVNDKYQAVNDEDVEKAAYGIDSDALKGYASFMVPFKDIKTDYDLRHLSKEDEDRYDQKDYDAEKDKDLDDTFGFKKDGQVAVFGATQTGLFMLVCVAIFVGICNSIQEICKERNILKREYMTNLRLDSYVVSKLAVQAVICAVQMVVVVLFFMVFVLKKQLPEGGVIFHSIWVEYFITMFLLAFAADTMSLLISSVVKTSELANTFIPIILIVQIVFSGVLFDMNGVMSILANLMISRWGINALAAITALNDSQPSFLIENPSLQLQLGSSLSTVKTEYASTVSNLLMIWGVLIVFIVVSSVACGVLLRRVKNDRR
ncbi:MAG: ABC transporter permease, partial [Acutalibacteraceae bacterium]